MLKGIDPLLSGRLLAALDELGHGDQVLIADRNFPAYAPGAPVIRVDSDLVSVSSAVLSVFPLDGTQPVARMQVGDHPELVHPQSARVLELAAESNGQWNPLERFAFYERAKQVALIVLTRESEGFANVILTKGAV